MHYRSERVLFPSIAAADVRHAHCGTLAETGHGVRLPDRALCASQVGVAFSDAALRRLGACEFADDEHFCNLEAVTTQLGAKECVMPKARSLLALSLHACAAAACAKFCCGPECVHQQAAVPGNGPFTAARCLGHRRAPRQPVQQTTGVCATCSAGARRCRRSEIKRPSRRRTWSRTSAAFCATPPSSSTAMCWTGRSPSRPSPVRVALRSASMRADEQGRLEQHATATPLWKHLLAFGTTESLHGQSVSSMQLRARAALRL